MTRGKHHLPVTGPGKIQKVTEALHRWTVIAVVATLGGAAIYLLLLAPTAEPTTYADQAPTTTNAPVPAPKVAPPTTTTSPRSAPQNGRTSTSRVPPVPAPDHPTLPQPQTFSAPVPAPDVDYRAGRTTVVDPRPGNREDLAQCAAEALAAYADDPISFVRDIALYRCLFFYDPNTYNSILGGLR